MEANPKYAKLADEQSINQTVDALTQNGFTIFVVNNKEESKAKALELLPKGKEIYNVTSKTLDQIGVSQVIMESPDYIPVRKEITALDKQTHARQMRSLGATPDVTIGSVHAITQQGQLVIASKTGSQLSSYVQGAEKVILVVSTKKIVKDLEEGLERIREYSWPLEDARARKAYGIGSAINKILIINADTPGRITIILVKEDLGF